MFVILQPLTQKSRKVGRVIDRAGLEIRYTLFGYRGFESLTFRWKKRTWKFSFFVFSTPKYTYLLYDKSSKPYLYSRSIELYLLIKYNFVKKVRLFFLMFRKFSYFCGYIFIQKKYTRKICNNNLTQNWKKRRKKGGKSIRKLTKNNNNL